MLYIMVYSSEKRD
uniref:Uncharacterized protein n=1 Tax=Anguilla anguilla TaxID=7936 RepID=A0A0E9VRM1_ANGAN